MHSGTWQMQVCELSTLSPMGLSSCSTNSTKLTLLLSSHAIFHMSEEVSVTLALSPPQLTWPQPTGLNEFYSPLTTITFARSLCCPVVHWKVEWIWFHGLAKWSSCPISTQTWLAPLVYQSRSIHLLESWLRMIHGEEKSKVWTHLTFARCPQLDLSSE